MNKNQETQVMQFNGNDVTFIKIDGDYWTPASDVARAIGYNFPQKDALQLVSRNSDVFEGISTILNIVLLEGDRYVSRERTVLNRQGIIAFCLKSDHKNAIPFQKWSVSKISELMSKGVVRLDSKQIDNQNIISLLRGAADEIEKRDIIISEMTPKVEAYESFIDSDTETSVREVAQLFAIPSIGQNNLYRYMRHIKMVDHNNMPYQSHVNAGHLRRVYNGLRPDGVAVYKTVFLTKGIDYIRKRLINDGHIKSTQHELV